MICKSKNLFAEDFDFADSSMNPLAT